jgi:hypothetical protein
MKKNPHSNPHYLAENAEKYDIEEYKSYPVSEDIYNKFKEETDIDPEDTTKVKKTDQDEEVISELENGINETAYGSDLDIPGSELDDNVEIAGNEDEENNYYSLGGDDHNDLDEDKDEL